MDSFLKRIRHFGLIGGLALISSISYGSNPSPNPTNQTKFRLVPRNVQIFRAESDDELNGLLQLAHLDYQAILRENDPDNPCYLFIFVDIDNVIFPTAADQKLFKNGATYEGLEVLIPETIQTLNQLLNEDNKISVLALTSSKAWDLYEKNEKNFLTKIRFSPRAMGDDPCHRIRAGALDAAQFQRRPFYTPFLNLGLPFVALNPVLEDFTPTQEQENSIKRVSLIKESSTQSFNSLNLFKCVPPKPVSTRRSQSRICSDPCLLAKNRPLFGTEQGNPNDNQNENQEQQVPLPDKRVVAYPFYSDGIIYSNFVDHAREGWQKGRIMRAYLETVFGQDFHTWPPIFVIAIDDNDMMLTNMEDESRAIGIRFKGLWFKRKEPVFWLFVKPKEEKKQPPQDDFDSDLMRFPKVLDNVDDE